jgi:hypothetical protein
MHVNGATGTIDCGRHFIGISVVETKEVCYYYGPESENISLVTTPLSSWYSLTRTPYFRQLFQNRPSQ